MLGDIRKQPVFTFEEYQLMLQLQCGFNPTEGDTTISKATDRNYSMYVIELHGMELENVN